MPRLATFPCDCRISVDGRAFPARTGEPLAVALLAAGHPLLSRSAKYHRPRGPFCLAGSCGSCLVRVDGLPDRRACRTPCRDGLTVETQNAVPNAAHDVLGAIDPVWAHGLDHHHLMTFSQLANRAAVAVSRRLAGWGRLPETVVPAWPAPAESACDALVVGSGPAGLAAAEALAESGRRVLVAEAEPVVGGRLRARLDPVGDDDLGWAARVCARVERAGGAARTHSTVIGLWLDGGRPVAALLTEVPSRAIALVRPARIVLAPGGTVQPPQVPDGDRPGVYGGRGIGAALAEHGAVPGARGVVLGSGAEAGALALRLREAGMEIALEADPPRAVRGRGRVRGVVLGDGRRLPCDTVAIAGVPAPATDLARALGVAVRLDPTAGAFAVIADADGTTAVPGLFAAGEVTGAMDAARAAEHGRRAGRAARG